MAKQLSFLQASGKIGDLVYYIRDGKPFVRKTARFNKDRFQNDPALSRWRANCAEFGRAGKAGKIVRTALANQLRYCGDPVVGSIPQLSKMFNLRKAISSLCN